MGCAASVRLHGSTQPSGESTRAEEVPSRRAGSETIRENVQNVLEDSPAITEANNHVEQHSSSSYELPSRHGSSRNRSMFFYDRPPPPRHFRSQRNVREEDEEHEEATSGNIRRIKSTVQKPPGLDLSCLPAPKFNWLDATPTSEEEPVVPYYCPICFIYTDSVFSCISCRHHLCAECLLQMTRENIKGDKDKGLQSEQAIKVFSKAFPGCNIDLSNVMSCCPHCREDTCQFKRLTKSDLHGKFSKCIRTYQDSPRTRALLSAKHVEETAVKIIKSAMKTALASVQSRSQPETDEV